MTALSKRRRTTLASSSSNATTVRQPLPKQGRLSATPLRYNARTRKMLRVAAAAATFSTSVIIAPRITTASAWVLGDISNRHQPGPMALYRSSDAHWHSHSHSHSHSDPLAALGRTRTTARSTGTQTRLYSSSRMRKQFQRDNNNNNDDEDTDTDRKELFGFRRTAKSVARKVLPTKWFGTQKEKEALERKQEVKNRVQGELDQMLKGAPLPLRMLGKFVAAPLMGKVASKVAEASYQQAETMEAILDETRSCLINDRTTVDLLGMPIQLGQPHSQSSATTIINGKRQMRMEFVVELYGPKGSGMSRVSATNEGVGQVLVEAMGKVYQVDLSSRTETKSSNRFRRSSSSSSSSSSFSRGGSGSNPTYNKGNDDNIIEAEIIDKKTNR